VDGRRSGIRSNASRQPTQPESGTIIAQTATTARASSSSDAITKESVQTTVEFKEKPSAAVAADTDGTDRSAAEVNSGASLGTLGLPKAEAAIITEREMIRKLPPTSAEEIRAIINEAGTLLTQSIKWLPGELQDGERTKEDVEAILCQTHLRQLAGMFPP